MWWVATATAVLALLTVATFRLRRSMNGLTATPGSPLSTIPLLIAQAETVGRGFRDLDEQARQVSRQIQGP